MALQQDLFLISMAAEMLGMHPQTLRKYERLGLIQPLRTARRRPRITRQWATALHATHTPATQPRAQRRTTRSTVRAARAEVMQRIRPLMEESALSTGSGRRQLLTEMRRLNDVIGL